MPPPAAMPDSTLRIEIAVPDRRVLDAESLSVQLPLTTGYLGVLPGHAPLLGEVGVGEVTYADLEGTEHFLAVGGGAVEVLPDRVRVLASHAELDTEIDVDRARRAMERANERLQLQSLEIDLDRAQQALVRAKARVATATRH